MTTFMIIMLCIDAVLLVALFAYVVVAILNRDSKKTNPNRAKS